MMIPRYLVSLGCSCNVAMYMKILNIKYYSCPFDWIFSNLRMIQDIIEDNFKIFLDRSEYDEINKKLVGHKQYHKNLFNHHNPLRDDDYMYFLRCVDRFKKILSSSEEKLFVHTCYHTLTYTPKYRDLFHVPYDSYKSETDQDFINFYEYLCSKTINFHLLIILQIPYSEPRVVKRDATCQDHMTIYELYLKGPTSGLEFTNKIDRDNYKSILNQYDFNSLFKVVE
jgi:hypothetical protein